MTETTTNVEALNIDKKHKVRKRKCHIAVGVILLLIILLFIIALILALTVFKPKQPRTQLLSATLDGVAPRVSFPAIKIELNITLDLKLLVENKNHASFKHGAGTSSLLYKSKQVGEAQLSPGFIPAMGSSTLPCRLTLEVDKMASDLPTLISDVLGGELVVETHTRIPGRVKFLGFIKKHVVAVSRCQFTLSVKEMKIKSQVCKSKTKL
ncbi:uncharacterized protein LOC107431405 [Ziziphus jujuba]|uniref:Uncharacterized protein LOC107431405 n=1 Tax=Ziziphus jujuba TaxID=326968 RepID=A0A6P4ANE1_ZIZJJ|nr:uncharacterized protein LOC107431405 [Ziziphus jujuba]